MLTYIILISLPYTMVAPGGGGKAYDMLKSVEGLAKMSHPKQDFQDPFAGNNHPYREGDTKGKHVSIHRISTCHMCINMRNR